MQNHLMSTYRPLNYCHAIGIDFDGGCQICPNSASFVDVQARLNHSKDIGHQKEARDIFERNCRYTTISENFIASLEEIENNRHRIDRLGHFQWRRHILADCIFTADGKCMFPNELLLRYEMKERISLLWLAAWRVACIHRLNEVQREGGIRALSSWLEVKTFVEHDWKRYRSEMRNSNRVNIIVERVVPFLC